MTNSFGKNILNGGIANILISAFAILRSILILRILGVNEDSDSFYLGISIIQILVINPISVLIKSGQPNLVRENNKFASIFILIGLTIIIIINSILFFGANIVFQAFTSSENLLIKMNELTKYLILFSIFQASFILFTGLIKSTISIKVALILEVISNFVILMLIIVLPVNTPVIDILIAFLKNYAVLSLLSCVYILIYIEKRIIIDMSWLKVVFNNMKNYLLSFTVSSISSWYEKFILTMLPAGSLAIYSIVTKGIAPITSVLVNPSVLLVSFASNSIEKSKKLLVGYFTLSSNLLSYLVVIVIYLSSIGTKYVSQVLNVDNNSSLLIIDIFQILSLSIFSSVIYTGFINFLGAFNKSKYIFYLNILGTVQLMLLFFVLKRFSLYGISSAIVINSFLLTIYGFVLFNYKLEFKLNSLFSLFSKKMLLLFLACIIFIIFELSENRFHKDLYIEHLFFILISFGYLTQVKKFREVMSIFK